MTSPITPVRRRRWLGGALAAALAVGSALVGVPAIAADLPPGGTGSISGSVSGFEGMVSLRLFNATTGTTVAQSTTTVQTAGTAYSVSSLAAGSYVLLASPGSLMDPTPTAMANGGAAISVADGAAVTGVDIAFGAERASATGTASIPVGTVPDGQLVSVSIEAYLVAGETKIKFTSLWSGSTHAPSEVEDGVLSVPFSLEVPPGAPWAIEFLASTCTESTVITGFCDGAGHEFFDASDVTSAVRGTVASGEELALGTIEFAPVSTVALGTVEGIVADSGGARLDRIHVELLDPETGDWAANLVNGPFGLPAEANGAYSASDIVPGSYLVRFVDASLTRPANQTMFAPAYLADPATGALTTTISQAAEITVVEGETLTIPEVRLSVGGVIRGSSYVAAPASATDPTLTAAPFTGDALYGIRPELYFRVADEWEQLYYASSYFGTSGFEFTMAGLPSGEYCLRFTERPSFTSAVRFAPSYHGDPGVESCDAATLVPVTAGESTDGVDSVFAYLEPGTAAESNDDFAETPESEALVTNDEFATGDTVTFDVGADYAGQWVSVFAHSEPTSFGWWVRVAADGSIAGDLPDALPSGTHSLVVQDADGAVLAWQAVEVLALPVNTSPPSISGTLRVGETLTAVPGAWTDDDELTFDYAWFAGNVLLGTDATLLLGPDDVGKSITLTELATSGIEVFGEASSAPSVPVALGTLVAGTPTIGGTPSVGESLAASPGTWPQSPTFAYQWWVEGAPDSKISGATGATFIPGPEFAGKSVYFVVTASKAGYETSPVPSAPVAFDPPVVLAPVDGAFTVPESGGAGDVVQIDSRSGGDVLLPSTSPGSAVVPSFVEIRGSSSLLAFAPGTGVTSADSSWDGTLMPPTVRSNASVELDATEGTTATVGLVIEVGDPSATLTFDRGVRLLLEGMGGKSAGFVPAGGTDVTPITEVCAADSQTVGDALPASGHCAITVGDDLVVWTKHFTSFVAYAVTLNAASIATTGFDGGLLVWIAALLALVGAVAIGVRIRLLR